MKLYNLLFENTDPATEETMEEGRMADFIRTLTGRDKEYLDVMNAAVYTPQDIAHDPEVLPLVQKYKKVLLDPRSYEQDGPLYNAAVNLTGSRQGKSIGGLDNLRDKVINAVQHVN